MALANDIGRFFVRKIERIRSDIEAIDVDLDQSERDAVPEDLEVDDTQTFSDFQLLTEDDVNALIQKSAKKSCSLDPMPTSFVVKCLDELLPTITCIINLSLSSSQFSEEWKEALVSPLLKKIGLNSEFCNLRPISNLQFISKLTERAFFDQMHNHMMRFDLYPVLQSAYRHGHSTETALLKLQNDILLNMDKKHITLLVFLDLSAAFDTVDHKILISRLKSSLGVRGNVLNWFSSYLMNRSQRITFSGCVSNSFPLPQGVPQGSCLGPLLFTIYSSKLFQVIRNHLPDVHAYADDAELYLSFKPDSEVSQTAALDAMERCVKDIRTWMIVNKLKINDGKTEFMIIGTKQQLCKVNIDHLTVGGSSINPVSVAKNLGTWFDSNLNFREHINKTCRAAYFHLNNIRRIRKYLSNESAKMLVHAFIIGRLDYCNSLLYGLPSVHLCKLQRVQNSAARIICNISRYDHITPVLYTLHWLPIQFRISFKILIFTFKAIHGLGPEYINNLIGIRDRSRYSLRSNSGLLLNQPSAKLRKTLGDRSFTSAAPALWNKLPLYIRNTDNFTSFKNILKTHLFKIAFNV